MKHFASNLARFLERLERAKARANKPPAPKVKPMRRSRAISALFRYAHAEQLKGPRAKRFPRPCPDVRVATTVRYGSVRTINFRLSREACAGENSPVLDMRQGRAVEQLMGVVRQRADAGRRIAAAEDVFRHLPAESHGSGISA